MNIPFISAAELDAETQLNCPYHTEHAIEHWGVMPTIIRQGVRHSPPPPWGEVARLFLLLAQVRWIDARLNFLYRGGRSPQGEKLLRLMERWLALHEAVAIILRRPLPPHVEQVRLILRVSSQHPRPSDLVC